MAVRDELLEDLRQAQAENDEELMDALRQAQAESDEEHQVQDEEELRQICNDYYLKQEHETHYMRYIHHWCGGLDKPKPGIKDFPPNPENIVITLDEKDVD